MTLQEITDEATKAAIAAVIAIVVTVLAGWISTSAKRLKTSVANMQNQKVPESIPRRFNQFLVMTGLIWMLLRTVAYIGPQPSGWDVVLIAAWTWAVLTYGLHVVRPR